MGGRKSDSAIVPVKPVKADGGKGWTHFAPVEEAAMQTKES